MLIYIISGALYRRMEIEDQALQACQVSEGVKLTLDV
jgi:hypothetical protein